MLKKTGFPNPRSTWSNQVMKRSHLSFNAKYVQYGVIMNRDKYRRKKTTCLKANYMFISVCIYPLSLMFANLGLSPLPALRVFNGVSHTILMFAYTVARSTNADFVVPHAVYIIPARTTCVSGLVCRSALRPADCRRSAAGWVWISGREVTDSSLKDLKRWIFSNKTLTQGC